MAIDTRNKRSSAILVGLPFRAMLPAPDGAIAQGDRQATAFMYSGILAGVVTPPAQPGEEYTLADQRCHFTIPVLRLHFTVPDARLHYTVEE